MITVHHLENSRSQRVLWLLEELGVPYEVRRYERDRKTMLAPPELRQVHPLGKSPVITDGAITVAESGAIMEYLVETYGGGRLVPPVGTPERSRWRYWMHYAEGSLMPYLVMKLVFMTIPKQPMPFFVRPIARALCKQVQDRLIDPNVAGATAFIESHLSQNAWFAGERFTLADVQMSFAVSALMARGDQAARCPAIAAYARKMEARPAYQRALAKGGPVIMSS